MSALRLTGSATERSDAAVPTDAGAQLLAIHEHRSRAWATADRGHLEALLAADFLFTSASGDWIERAGYLERAGQPMVSAADASAPVRVRLFGTGAVLQGVCEETTLQGPPVRMRYTDVYHWSGTGWRLVNAQNTQVREDVESALRLGTASPCPPWRGEDPVGDAHLVLQDLNSHYVRAFRACDVAWYDAHLAQDFTVVNSDGSLDDRARALEAFAQPAFATLMRTFPVDKVRIRRFGNLALIHAENDYELKDGRRGVNRYTDIWHWVESGRWLCRAAHITTHRSPG